MACLMNMDDVLTEDFDGVMETFDLISYEILSPSLLLLYLLQ